MPEARYSEQFQRAIRKAKLDLATVRAACEEILADPLSVRGSHLLRYEWSGFRGADLDRRRRIIYRVCEECIRCHHQEQHPLDCCGWTTRDDGAAMVNFVDLVDYHESAGRRRGHAATQYGFAAPEPAQPEELGKPKG